MMSRLKFQPQTFLPLIGVAIKVSDYATDDIIVLRCPKPKKSTNLLYQPLASFHLSIWNLKDGSIKGDCPLNKASELHISPKRYDELKRMIDDYEKDYRPPEVTS